MDGLLLAVMGYLEGQFSNPQDRARMVRLERRLEAAMSRLCEIAERP